MPGRTRRQLKSWLLLAFCFVALLLTACAPNLSPTQPVTAVTPLPSPSTLASEPDPATYTLDPPATHDATHISGASPPATPEIVTGPAPCQARAGRMQTGSLDTPLLREPLEYRVYLPPCYAAEPEKRYPVLYLFHGQGFDDVQWDRIGIDETADRLIAAGEIPPLLIVMPHDRALGDISASNFEQAFLDAFVPFIDTTYRSRLEWQYRAIGGLSRGGAMAIHIGIREWQSFGVIGAHSPAIFVSDTQFLPRWLDAISPAAAPRIYIDIGDRDLRLLEQAVWFEKLLDERDLAHEWRLFSGDHSEPYWSAHVEQYLRWYTQGW